MKHHYFRRSFLSGERPRDSDHGRCDYLSTELEQSHLTHTAFCVKLCTRIPSTARILGWMARLALKTAKKHCLPQDLGKRPGRTLAGGGKNAQGRKNATHYPLYIHHFILFGKFERWGERISLVGKIGKSVASRQFSRGFLPVVPISRRRRDADFFLLIILGSRARTMWLRNWLIGVVLASWALFSSAAAQQPIHWQWSLESAKQVAGQTNRLVLVHFWADWCSPCKRMEQDVFSRPDVAAALEADYVAVKLHKDHFPATAKEYGVTGIPADVILTPQGQVVERFQGYADASQYVGRLNRVAANYRMQSGRIYAQIPSQPAAGAGPAMPGVSGGPYGAAGYQPAQGAQAFANNHAVNPQGRFPQVGAVAANPPYAGMPSAVQVDPTLSPYGKILPRRRRCRRYSSMPPAQGRRVAAMNRPYGGLIGRPSGPSIPAQIQCRPRGPNRPERALPRLKPCRRGRQRTGYPMGGTVGADASPSPVVEVPAGNPPLALDGYCPVLLTEKERWVRGNVKWGVRHEGRTYLFAGPEEQGRFYAEPDRFAPVLGGDDVVLMVEQGQHVLGRREHGGWFQNRVYLFASEASFQKFFADPHRYANAVAQRNGSVASRPGARLPVGGTESVTPWTAPNPAGAVATPYYR